jgi:hypothetical protein
VKIASVLVLAACGARAPVASAPGDPEHPAVVPLDGPPRQGPRMVPPEAYLRAYLTWFGRVSPNEARLKARGWNLFGDWSDYLAALGLPDHQIDVPRATQSNAMMLATIGRLGEALCIRSAERDLHPATAAADRMVFAFDVIPQPTPTEFATRFDVLHRTFLSYPAELAPAGRTERYHALYQRVVANHRARERLAPDVMAWAAVCAALVLHPEAGLY